MLDEVDENRQGQYKVSLTTESITKPKEGFDHGDPILLWKHPVVEFESGVVVIIQDTAVAWIDGV